MVLDIFNIFASFIPDFIIFLILQSIPNYKKNRNVQLIFVSLTMLALVNPLFPYLKLALPKSK